MNLNRNFAMMLAQPWAIRAASMAVMMEALAYERAALTAMDSEEETDDGYEVSNGIATIKIHGVIGKKIPRVIAKMFGMTDVDDISALVTLAESDPEVKGVLLDIDSPGGTVMGVPEAAQKIRDMDKPCFAYTDGMMASAAYWLGAGAAGVFASQSAIIGSIGVFVPFADMRRMYDMAGIEMDIIKSGAFKGAGWPGTSLSPEQRDNLQKGVLHTYGLFSEFVAARTGTGTPISKDVMQGQDFGGDQAADAGLIDGVSTRSDVLKALAEYS